MGLTEKTWSCSYTDYQRDKSVRGHYQGNATFKHEDEINQLIVGRQNVRLNSVGP